MHTVKSTYTLGVVSYHCEGARHAYGNQIRLGAPFYPASVDPIALMLLKTSKSSDYFDQIAIESCLKPDFGGIIVTSALEMVLNHPEIVVPPPPHPKLCPGRPHQTPMTIGRRCSIESSNRPQLVV